MASARLVLFLFVINLGIAFGAGFYESVIVLPHWLAADANGTLHWDAHAAATDNTGQRFWIFVSTIPLTILAVANLYMGWRRCTGSLRTWWVAGTGLAAAERVMTFLYFIPAMVGLMQSPDSPEAVASAHSWMNLNYVRHGLLLGAWLAALRTYALAQNVRKRMPAYYEVRERDAREEVAR
jgi:hypothetical protein